MKMKVFIVVKTYPALSSKYDEIVCTAGINENGDWIRIYPIPFRKLLYEKRYSKYQWIEFEVEKNLSDFRPESYKPKNLDFNMGIAIDTKKDPCWLKRRKIVLKNVYYNLDTLIADAKNPNKYTSLVTFKATEIIKFEIEETDREWDRKKLLQFQQMDLFSDNKDVFEVVRKLPYKFSYIFKDDSGKKSKLMIEDWEIGQLYWNCLKSSYGDEKEALEKVKLKYFDELVLKKDLYLFLGTTQAYHNVAKNPFIIIGAFYPNKIDNKPIEQTLFDL